MRYISGILFWGRCPLVWFHVKSLCSLLISVFFICLGHVVMWHKNGGNGVNNKHILVGPMNIAGNDERGRYSAKHVINKNKNKNEMCFCKLLTKKTHIIQLDSTGSKARDDPHWI